MHAIDKKGGPFTYWYWWLLGAVAVVVIGLLIQPAEEERVPTTAGRGEETRAEATPPAKEPTDRTLVAARKQRPLEVLTEGFTSSSACRECHQDQHQSWHHSYHRTMTQVVNAETAPDVIRDGVVTVDGRDYRFEHQGDKFFVTFADPLRNGSITRRQIVMMTGSHHMHVFWYETEADGTPGELDIVYLIEAQRWIPRLASFLRPPVPEDPELGTWNATCSKCHATHARERFRAPSRTWDTQVVEFGIACEACHGQGAEHIKRYSSENESLTESDKIVNPITISKQASADVCGRCHSVWMPDYDALSLEDYRKDGNPLQPGELLSESAFNCIIQAGPQDRESEPFQSWSKMEDPSGSFWEDGMVRVAGREYNGLLESPCYQHGDMTCLSCHTMHPPADSESLDDWRDDQLKPGMRGDQACLQCHTEMVDRITEHTHHAPDSSGSRCQNCHMPYTTFGLLKSIRSHQISSPSVETSLKTDRPSACAICHLDQTFTWTAEHLHKWYDQPGIEIDPNADAATTATSVIHFLKGDAGQRALQAWAFGWEPAREASGTDWMEPFLLFGANDPYDAVRIIAARSLESLPNRVSESVDPLGDEGQRFQAFSDAIEKLSDEVQVSPRSEVLVDENGKFDLHRIRSLMDQRNHRPMGIRE